MLNIKLFDAGHLNDKCPNDMLVECQTNLTKVRFKFKVIYKSNWRSRSSLWPDINQDQIRVKLRVKPKVELMSKLNSRSRSWSELNLKISSNGISN